MSQPHLRVLLDTNVFIIGFLELDSFEGKLLQKLMETSTIVLIFSNDLEEQIRRVGKRLKNKDWVGQLLNRIWRDYHLEFVCLDAESFIIQCLS